ncbi:MAG: nuclear transport factor 2 family protein [Woeseia sp.]
MLESTILNRHFWIYTVAESKEKPLFNGLCSTNWRTRMKKVILALSSVILFAGAFAHADEATEKEVIKTIMDGNAYAEKNLKDEGDTVSKDGSLEFWSSGGFLQEVSAGSTPDEYESINIDAKHIHVITLVPGKVAVAQYYSEGSMAPKGSTAVSNYRTRATQVFVKENGKWKVRAAHWSPIAGGSGTSQTAVN